MIEHRKMHAKTDSEGTSLATSSPEHNRRPVYFVQSPDAEKFTASFESTPGVNSPSLGSPRHCHSRESSTSRFSGSLKSGFKRMPPNGVGLGGTGYRTGGEAIWKEYDDAIEEEGLLEDEEPRRGSSPRCYLIGFVVVFIVLFSLFSLILLGVSKHYRPRIGMTVSLPLLNSWIIASFFNMFWFVRIFDLGFRVCGIQIRVCL